MPSGVLGFLSWFSLSKTPPVLATHYESEKLDFIVRDINALSFLNT